MAATCQATEEMVSDHTTKLADIDSRSKYNTHRLNKQEKTNEKLNNKIDTVQKMQFTISEVKNGIDRLNEKMENQQDYQTQIVKNLKEDINIQRKTSEANTKHIVEALGKVMAHTNEKSISPWFIVIRDASINALIIFLSGLLLWNVVQYGNNVSF